MTAASGPGDDLGLARLLAGEASTVLLNLRGRGGASAHALGAEGDRRAEAVFAHGLARYRPGDAVLSEEAADDRARLDTSRVWIVDPLDGTWEYAHGTDDFSVHIALWSAGSLEVGVVALPARGVVHDTGRSDARLGDGLRGGLRGGPLRIVVSRSRPPTGIEAIRTVLVEHFDRPVEVYPRGGAGAKAADVLEGNADLYIHDEGMSEWDIAAPAAVATAAGYTVCHTDGSPLEFNHWPPYVGDVVLGVPDVVAAVVAAHR